jgi:hypothetical protein
VALLPSHDLGAHSPSRDVGHFEHGTQVLGEVLQDRAEFFFIEEARPCVVLAQHRHVWTKTDLPSAFTQPEHPLERSQLPINRSVSRSLCLTVGHISTDLVRRHLDRPCESEHTAQVSHRALYSVG